MGSIVFNYTDSKGVTKDWELVGWAESGKYLKGTAVQDGKYRTFRKDRINKYLGEGEAVLVEPYIAPPPKLESRPEILFTGFAKALRADLEKLAAEKGMMVRKTVTKDLAFLCCGPNAGPTKVEKAREQGCFILNRAALLVLFETGELPDEDDSSTVAA